MAIGFGNAATDFPIGMQIDHLQIATDLHRMPIDILSRAKNILLTPKTEWQVIAGEKETTGSLLIIYVLPLTLVQIFAAIAQGLIYGPGMISSLRLLGMLVSAPLSFLLNIYAVDWLSSSFQSDKNIGRSGQLVAYSWTASTLCSVLNLLPGLGPWLTYAGFFYTFYLQYLGLGPLKNTPDDKKVPYIIFIFLTLFLIILALYAFVLYTGLLAMVGWSNL